VAEQEMSAAPAQKNELLLALNSGSSSLKFGLYQRGASDEEALLTGTAEGIGRDNGTLKIHGADRKTLIERDGILESQSAALATGGQAIREHVHGDPLAVGHRIVHGGPKLVTHQRITPEVLDELRAATHFAPLHIPQALQLIAAAERLYPAAEQFACFDDVFHQSMPEVAKHLPLPQSYFDSGVRRYGFHGLSYESLVHHFGAQLPPRAIFAHLGNGASLCAVRDGASIDTTMGLTPTGGIPMGTRLGDVDPGVLIQLMRTEKLGADELEELVNHRSGLSGLSGGESDVRALEERAHGGDTRAKLALDVFAMAVRKEIGAYVALLGGVDLLVFTGGIGEHSEYVRRTITAGLECLGLTAEKIKIVHAEEEKQLARHCRRMMEEVS
jgi:acetate kinase